MKQLKITPSITRRDHQSLDKYLQEIGKEPMITAQEEVALAEARDRGDRTAIDKLTRANLRFVVSVAKQYQSQGTYLLDLINEGNIGLIKAAEKFDPTRGFKFISYAVWRIRQSIMAALSENNDMIRKPLNQVGRMSQITKTSITFEQLHQRKPTSEEIAQALDLEIWVVEDTLWAPGKHLSLDKPFDSGEESGSALSDLVPGDEQSDTSLHESDLSADIAATLNALVKIKSLNPRGNEWLTVKEADIIKMFFGLDCEKKSLEEIANVYGLTRERVRQINEKGIRHLRKSKVFEKYREYL